MRPLLSKTKIFSALLLGIIFGWIAFTLLPHIKLSTALVNRDSSAGVVKNDAATLGHFRGAYAALPLTFEANLGQTDGQVKFLSRGNGYNFFLTPTEAVLALSKPDKGSVRVIRMKLVGSNPSPKVVGVDELAARSHYFIANDPQQWRFDVPTYAKVKIRDVYPGVDLVFYGNQQQLEYDFVVAPGAEPNEIRFAFQGAQSVRIDEQGDLVVKVTDGEIRQHKPRIFQERDGIAAEVAGHYVIDGKDQVGFRVAAYDSKRALFIDPILSYSTYIGGDSTADGDRRDQGFGLAVDSLGNAYLTGFAQSADFPQASPLQPSTGGGGYDAFITKLSPDGRTLLYSTFLGGRGDDRGHGIALDRSGNAYVTGYTSSTDFPTANPRQSTNAGRPYDAFVSKLSVDGRVLMYSTYLGGSGEDRGHSVVVDGSNNAYVVGYTTSSNFPTSSAFQGTYAGGAEDAFVAKLDAEGRTLLYSTYLGGRGYDRAYDVAVDNEGNAYVTGYTISINFPTARPLQSSFGSGFEDAFVTKLDPEGRSLVFSTYLGGSGSDRGARITIDGSGNIYVTGYSDSLNFPTVNAIQPLNEGGYDAFVTKLNADGSNAFFSTYLGGTGSEGGVGIALDASENIYVTGFTTSLDFPTMNALQPFSGGLRDAFVTKFNAGGSVLLYSTYLGGTGYDGGVRIAVNSSGDAYVTGYTNSTDFPTSRPFQPTLVGGYSAFLAKLDASDIRNSSEFMISDRALATLTASGGPTSTSSGYIRIVPRAGSAIPVGLAILALRSNTITVAEAGFLAPPRIQNGRIYAEVKTPVTTMVAIANPNDQEAAISFHFTDTSGSDSGSGNTTIPSNGQIAGFLNQAPFNGGTSIEGTFTFSSSVPVSVIALRGYNNERSEFLATALPVTDLSTPETTPVFIPQFATGGGWSTQVLLVNPTEEALSGVVEFLGQGSATTLGGAATVTIGEQTASRFEYSIPARGSQRFQIQTPTSESPEGTPEPQPLRVGWVRILANPNTRIPAAVGILSLRNVGVVATEVSVPAVGAGSQFRVYAEVAGNFLGAERGAVQTGLALANPSERPAVVSFEVTDLDGRAVGLTGRTSVPGNGQVALFLTQIPGFESLARPFRGLLRISTPSSPGIAVAGLRARYNEREEFVIGTTPPFNEANATSEPELVIPHLFVGGGSSTQLILLSGGPSSAGVVRLFSQAGQPLNVILR